MQPLDRRTASWSTPRGSLLINVKRKADWAAHQPHCLLAWKTCKESSLLRPKRPPQPQSKAAQQSSLESESPGDIVHLGVRARRSRRRDTIKKSSKNSVFFTTKKINDACLAGCNLSSNKQNQPTTKSPKSLSILKQKVAVMPASLYPNPNPASLSLGNLDLIMMESSSGGSSGSGSGFDHQISNGHHNSINGGGGLGLTASNNGSGQGTDSRAAAEQIAMQLAMLQQGDHQNGGHGNVHHGNNLNGQHHQMQNGHHQHHSGILNQLNSASASDLLNGHGASGSLEDLKSTQRRSQNMTECVPVPSSEHVAEIVGRQGKNSFFY